MSPLHQITIIVAICCTCVLSLACFAGGWAMRTWWIVSRTNAMRRVLERHGAPPNRIMYQIGRIAPLPSYPQ